MHYKVYFSLLDIDLFLIEDVSYTILHDSIIRSIQGLFMRLNKGWWKPYTTGSRPDINLAPYHPLNLPSLTHDLTPPLTSYCIHQYSLTPRNPLSSLAFRFLLNIESINSKALFFLLKLSGTYSWTKE